MRIGSTFTGTGALDLAVAAAFGLSRACLAWTCDKEAGPRALAAARFPGVPHMPDITKIDWWDVEPVDILAGGSPCQDLSHAGKRAGMGAGTRSGLWASMREGVAIMRPQFVVWENVRGALRARADSSLVECSRCVDDPGRPGHAPHLRALGRVLGDLADLGYDTVWYGLPASTVGAPHRRFRIFVLAWDATRAAGVGSPSLVAHPGGEPVTFGSGPAPGGAGLGRGRPDDGGAPDGDGDDPWLTVSPLLPTPAVNDMGRAYTPATWDAWTAKMRAAHGNGNGHGKSLSIEAARMSSGFGAYEPAITRWEGVTRSAPDPVDDDGRLAVGFVEWMMGLPEGWVSDLDLTRAAKLRLLGNGVVPQQATASLQVMLTERRRALLGLPV